MSGELGEHCHGKGRVRVARRWTKAGPGGKDVMKEWQVQCLVWTPTASVAYTRGDNSAVIATDSVKNSVYVAAKSLQKPTSCEDFAALVAAQLVSRYSDTITRCEAVVREKPWVRSGDHDHGFIKAGETRTCTAVATQADGRGTVRLTSGLEELSVLKTTQSGWENYVHDGLTLLKPTRERMMASSVTASWTYGAAGRAFNLGETLPAVAKDPSVRCYEEVYQGVKQSLVAGFFGPERGGKYSNGVQETLFDMGDACLARFPQALDTVTLEMPNLHFNPCRFPAPVDIQFHDDIFVPVDEPHGMIKATVRRVDFSGGLQSGAPRSRM